MSVQDADIYEIATIDFKGDGEMKQEHIKISWHKFRNWVEIKVIGDKAYYEHFNCGWYIYEPLDGNYDNMLTSREELGNTIGKKTVLNEEFLIAPHFAKVSKVYF